MKNTLFNNVDINLNTAKQTIKNIFNICQTKNTDSNQLNFSDIISEVNQVQSKNIKQLKITQKIQQAIRNSCLAKSTYHDQKLQRKVQQGSQPTQLFKTIQNQISMNNVSKIMELKKDQKDQQDKIQTQGVLLKFSPSFFGGWSHRYCVLTQNKFIYYQNQNKNSPIAGYINFNILSFSIFVRYSGQSPQSFQIKVDKGEKSFIFKAQNSDETMRWYFKIDNIIQESQGKINNVTALSNYNRFWRKEYITQKQFQKSAKTGDIVLFRGKKNSAILQRVITGQQYDHIGVVLLNSFDQILIFQANGGFGVGICPWKKFIKNKWFQDQQIVAIRHLKIQRTQQFLAEVKKFIEDNIGKPYKFSLKNYLISRNSEINNEKTSYFCSSLVAKLYKTIGLLDPNASSSRYLPYDFSDKQKLNILNGKHGKASLEQQKIIVFEKKSRNKIFQKE